MSAPVAIPYSSTPVVPVVQGNKYFLLGPVTGSAVVSFSFSPEGAESCRVALVILQDSSGSRAVTFAANVYGAPATSSDGASTYRVLNFFYDEVSQGWFYSGGSVS